MYMNDFELAEALIIVAMLFIYLVIFASIALVFYVLSGIAFSKVAKINNLSSWKAWVPFCSSDLLLQLGKGKRKRMWIVLGIAVALLILSVLFSEIAPILTVLFYPVGIGFIIWFDIYTYIMLYRITGDLGVSKTLFWVSVFVSPVYFGLLFEINKKAKAILKNSSVQA